MRRFGIYITVLFFAINLASCEKTEEFYEWEGGSAAGSGSGGGPIVAFTQVNSPWTGTLDCIDARNYTNLVIGGTATNVIVSSDTGSSWSTQSGNFWSYVNDVKFENSNTGYVANNQGDLFRTLDGGTTWTMTPSNTTINVALNAVDFYNFSGIAVGQVGQMCRSFDGGTTWSPYGFSNVYNDMYDVAVYGNNAYIVGEAGFVVFTPDLAASNWYYASVPSGLGVLRKVHFATGLVGYIVGNNGTVLKTTNAGSNWTQLSFPSTTNLLSVAFQDEETGVVVGAGGELYFTRNGGSTWGALNSGTTNSINDIIYVSGRYIAVGSGGYIAVSPDL